ncbi:asparaginase domain-containing protein [Thiomicrorhabdus sp. ZW0627]|uniref:asparaginase domain-containing protein n=1 Tax=Thiomicrorhabdus sp. ZW0627 TaxID=3039774 RepID=UPI0024372DB1|nr:asparaginase domain-containing protein [Thiomicrorhabdus sp. ZW0627]MDG6772951.1 asparaginase domain-containing protein [Thiomicrorhabdus sp. ZW0627]
MSAQHSESEAIQLFITGGTIDKDYDAILGELVFPVTNIPELLFESNCTLPITVDLLMQKDSLQMDGSDREKISQACQESECNRIVITHGTDTMVETALWLKGNAELSEKTIVLTGAMRPYKLGRSDAGFNMGAAMMAVQTAKAGVFICMNGRLFEADQVKKNRSAGLFENR